MVLAEAMANVCGNLAEWPKINHENESNHTSGSTGGQAGSLRSGGQGTQNQNHQRTGRTLRLPPQGGHPAWHLVATSDSAAHRVDGETAGLSGSGPRRAVWRQSR